MIYTFGYAGTDPQQLYDWIVDHGAMLVDVRKTPWSNDARWRMAQLVARFTTARYIHVPAFGNANYKNGGPIALAEPQRGLSIVCPIVARQPIVLLCGCWSHTTCHRTQVAELIWNAVVPDQLVEHLHWPKKRDADPPPIDPDPDARPVQGTLNLWEE